MESEHGTRARYRKGCTCDDCRSANNSYVKDQAGQARNRRLGGQLDWPDALNHEATTHDVRTVPRARRLAMALRRTAETVRDASGLVASPSALVALLYVAADELDTKAHAGQNTEEDAPEHGYVGVVPATAANGADPALL